jgi:hypothetical protein
LEIHLGDPNSLATGANPSLRGWATDEGHPGDDITGFITNPGDVPEGGGQKPTPLGQEALSEERGNGFPVS